MDLPRLPLIMGVVNVTPDSFFDGGDALDPAAALKRAMRLLDEGADIIDIGGESSRPPGHDYGEGAERVPLEEELNRTIPVIRELISQRPDAIVSIDTVKAEVARRAVEAGAAMINDISAGRYDAEMFGVAAGHDVSYVMMHGYDPADIRPAESYRRTDVVGEVFAFLSERIKAAREAGIERIIADVGIGFSKGAEENMTLLRQQRRFTELGVPLLVGASRKAFIGRKLGGANASERLFGTLGAHAAAVINGAAILRVHDVRETSEFFTLFNEIAGAGRLREATGHLL